MYPNLFAAATISGLLLVAPALADAGEQTKPCPHEKKAEAHACGMPCCADHAVTAEPTADDLSALDLLNPQWAPEPVVRQEIEVWFQRPVRVGGHILQGRYVIQHDNKRMASGKPCTHIYAWDDRQLPVVRFNCTHLDRDRASANIVVVSSLTDVAMQQLVEFQFAGEAAAHGVPIGRNPR